MQNAPVAQRTLERGGACIFCRKRKVKCDGGRPACGRCSGVGRAQDCQYVQRSRGQTESEHLEASIARLERKIRQLGGTLPTSPEVLVHEPHLEGLSLGSSFSSWNSRNRDRPPQAPYIQVTLSENWWQTPVPPQNVTKMLVDCFARHASQFGFFLNGPRIMRSVFSPDPQRPISSSLLNSILLFGIHLSGFPAMQAREAVFLERAVRSVAPVRPHQVTQNIQAEVLLAQYFLREGRFLEAMHRINTAASLAIGCGLHRLSGPHSERETYALPSTRDAVEQGERVNAFWTIMALHKIFSIIMRWPSSVSDILDEQIDLPWPLEMEVYESGIVPINPRHQFTMKEFLDDPMTANFEAANSCLAQHAKAAALFERASHMAGIEPVRLEPLFFGRTNCSHVLRSCRPGRIRAVHVIRAWVKSSYPDAPIFRHHPGSIDTIRQCLVNFTLCQAAIIQLHSASDNPASIHKCLNAASAVVAANQRIPNMQVWEHIDSTMGTLWVAICQVIIRGIATIKNPRISTRGWAASVSNSDYPALKSAFANITSTMSIFSSRCRLIDYQLNAVQESYKTLCH
ncbi:hypothetical protein B0H13DRAFT_800211 [Mycena leptocephala]|nr:hypothetical protein B0H13DRAFT_800211 [Mycena leptocephala]